MKFSLQLSLLGLGAILLTPTTSDAKTMKQQPEAVIATQDIEETEQIETITQPQRMRLLPGAQRRVERRRGEQPKTYTREQHSSSKTVIRSNNGGVSVNITSPQVSETKHNVIVTMNVGVLAAKDIMVEVKGNDIYIAGEYKHAGTQISINDSASLPCAVHVHEMNKAVSNGVLTITLPKVK